MKNFGRLKLDLIRRGVFVGREIRGLPEVSCGVCAGEPGEEIGLALAEDFIVKAVMKPEPKGCARLKRGKDGIRLVAGEDEVEVGIIPLPGFIANLNKERSPVSENVCLDGYCLNIFLRAVGRNKGLSLPMETIHEVIQSAFDEGSADLVQINMDFCEEKDRGFNRLAPVVETIKKKFQTFVALKGFPPQDKRTIDHMYACGVDLLNFPLEGFAGVAESKELAPLEEAREALDYAVGIFPRGTVWTELVLQPSKVIFLKEKIDGLTRKGVIPLLKLQSLSLLTGQESQLEEDAVRHLEQAAQREKLPLKWLYPNCRYVTPLDAQFFLTGPETSQLAVKPVYQSKFSKKALEGFAAIRRRLRIKNVSDSYESAGL